MSAPKLSSDWTEKVLKRLGVSAAPPTRALLDQLVSAYIRTVPWESAFRMAKRARTAKTADCPRWPEEFWQDNIERGGGGTCFESNFAFFHLLNALGFQGYLTINNMRDSIGCHTAIVLYLNGMKWLTDVGIPLHVPIPISTKGTMHRSSKFLSYSVQPLGDNTYQIEYSPHPSPYIFTLIDKPVTIESYRAAIMADHGENGFFLDRVIINKIVRDERGNERPWRFNTGERPWVFNNFVNGVRTDKQIVGDTAVVAGNHFSMDADTIRVALASMEQKSND